MLKQIRLAALFTLSTASVYFAQTKVYGYLQDSQSKIVEGAEVQNQTSLESVITDKIGYFQMVDVRPGTYKLLIQKSNYEPKVIDITVAEGEKKLDLGVIQLNYVTTNTDTGIVLADDAMADDDGSSMQPTVGLLSAGRDAFQNAAAFELGGYWFRPRGIDNRYEDVLFNGIPMSKNDNGRIEFSNWSGLNDVTRYPMESADNLTPSENTFGNLGGVVYFNTRASGFRKGTSIAYSNTNRSYYHRIMATHSTGLTKNGWALTLSGSRRWAEGGIIDGMYQDSYAYFGALEKKFSDRFSINFTTFGAPTYRAINSPNTDEVYNLMGKNYNAYWGWQDGEKRNSRIRKTFEPVYQLTIFSQPGASSNWVNTLSYQTGYDSRSRLDWFHGADPHPTYYRNLPSYILYKNNVSSINELSEEQYAEYNALVNEWKNNPSVSQIDWKSLYAANMLNQYDMNGNPRGATYSMVADVNEDETWNFHSHFDTKLKDNWKLNLNFNYQNLVSDNFREVTDLLGGLFVVNRDAFGNDQKFNLDSPTDKAFVGDRVNYSYDLLRESYTLNASTEIDLKKWNIMASVFGGYVESQRDGNFRNYLYQNNSKGESSVFSSYDAGIKGKVTYKINGKNFLVYNGTYFSLSPTLNEIYINPRMNDFVTPDVKNQLINANELSFISRGQNLKLRLSGFYTTIDNSTEISRYFSEGFVTENSIKTAPGQEFVTEVLANTSKRYIGAELGADIRLIPTLNAIIAVSYGDYTYTNNPQTYLNIDSENFAKGYQKLGEANMKGLKVAGTPQQAYSLGLRYNSPKYWWVGASFNYLDGNYLRVSAINRTKGFQIDPATGDPYTSIDAADLQRVLSQRKFEGQYMLNANLGKSFLFGKYRMGVSVSVNNILNNRDYVTGGYEQGRKSSYPDAIKELKTSHPLFGPKLWYDRGRTYFANIYLRF